MKLALIACAAAALLCCCLAAYTDSITVAQDGAFCWFADPRGLQVGSRTFLGWVGSTGDVGVTHFDHATGANVEVVIHPKFEVDDHDNPAILHLIDGRLVLFYTKHASEPVIYWTVSKRANDATSWTGLRALTPVPAGNATLPYGVTYPNPYLIEGGRVAMFFRGVDWKPSLMISTDPWLSSWSPATIVFTSPGHARPYMKCVSNGAGRIHFAMTDGHPRDVPNNKVYHAYLEGGSYFRADGTRIKGLGDGPLTPGEVDTVYDASRGKGWVWDIALTAAGQPVVTLATFLEGDTRHSYRYATWAPGASPGNGGGASPGWVVNIIIGDAGGWFLDPVPGQAPEEVFEKQYSGGVTLDPSDPSVVYLSREISGVFEIERWQTADGGRTWVASAITSGSAQNNVRPFVPRQPPGVAASGTRVITWMEIERYVLWRDYKTSLKMRVVG